MRGKGDAAAGDRVVILRDGRVMGYREYGAPDGVPVIALHGTPGSRLKYAGAHEAAVVKGLRLLALDRWGYGLSDAKRDPVLADYGRDAEELADKLGLERFAVTGVSGGGPFAVAVAASLKDRVCALALVSPVGVIAGAPVGVTLRPLHALCFRLAPRIPGLLAGSFQAYRAVLAAAPNLALRMAVPGTARADREIVREGRVRAGMVAAFSEGLARGVDGPVTDMALFGRPWGESLQGGRSAGVDFAGISAQVRIWIGLQDRNVPLAAVRALRRALPTSEYIEIVDAGHQWLAANHAVVLDWIRERARQ